MLGLKLTMLVKGATWRLDGMETIPALLPLREGNAYTRGGVSSQMAVSADVLFCFNLNKVLNRIRVADVADDERYSDLKVTLLKCLALSQVKSLSS